MIDPYESRWWLGYDFPAGLHATDAVLSSHPHSDHDGGLAAGRDLPWPSNTIWLLQVAGLRIVHVGDNGPLTDAIIKEIGRVDVLMLPIDSLYHILKHDEIEEYRAKLAPQVLIPMHYRHPDLETDPDSPDDLGEIDDWLSGQDNVRRLKTHVWRFTRSDLADRPEVVVFEPSPKVKPPS